jgi:general secretion pathway protein B
MSFILDALKRSDAERQQQGSTEFASVPTSSQSPRAGRWIWLLVILLAVNLVVLLGVLLRPDEQPAAPVTATSPPADDLAKPAQQATDDSANFTEQVATLRQNRGDTPPVAGATSPARQAADGSANFAEQVAAIRQGRSDTTPVADVTPSANTTQRTIVAPQRSRGSQSAAVATIDELRLDGSLQVAELHLDLHVYSEAPSERFVFINTIKYREQSKLAEGPVVMEITTTGVILNYQGQTFLLPRE